MATLTHSELLIGCGSERTKRLHVTGGPAWRNLVTLDYNKDHKPDVVHDLLKFPYPFADNTFSEVHAYEVLEHTGTQGDYRFFFRQFSELWRILRPGGLLLMTCPAPDSVWVWGDPSHTRVVQKESLIFLDQLAYQQQVGVTPMSDFRNIYQADFRTIFAAVVGGSTQMIVEAIKPSRWKPVR